MKTNLSLLSLEKHLRFCPRKAKITIEGFISNFFTLHENDPMVIWGGGQNHARREFRFAFEGIPLLLPHSAQTK